MIAKVLSFFLFFLLSKHLFLLVESNVACCLIKRRKNATSQSRKCVQHDTSTNCHSGSFDYFVATSEQSVMYHYICMYICNALNIYDHNSHGKFIDIKTVFAIAFIALYGFITTLTSISAAQSSQATLKQFF